MTSPYSTDKLRWHSDLLLYLRDRKVPPAPRVVHLMPELGCTQRCRGCAYAGRHPEDQHDAADWKNRQMYDLRNRLSYVQAARFVDDFEAMGGKAIELTGGGEPLLWPHVWDFFNRLHRDLSDIELALVTNGVLLDERKAVAFGGTNWKWARVSIDAGNAEQYMETRRVPPSQWRRAWDAVERLVALREQYADPEQRVGVGYVVDSTNHDGVYDGCRLAKEHGADNIRVSIAFTPYGEARFPSGALREAENHAQAAVEDLQDETFRVHNLVAERKQNLASSSQDYPYCVTKDILCVVGGDANVYACCSLAFNKRGLIGSIEPRGFRALWEAVMPTWSSRHDPRRDCPVACLYEKRNREALTMIDGDGSSPPEGEPPPHLNYL